MGLSKEHDWVMETLYNPSFTNTDFKTVGINTSNTSIAPLDVYLKLPEIQNMPQFQTNGKFDSTKVQQYYYKALTSYNKLAKDTYEQDLDMNQDAIFASNNFFVAPNRRMQGPQVSLTFEDNPTRQTFGVVEINTPGRSYKTIEEIAQSNQIWDSRTGKFTEETPEDSFFKNFFRPMALATWEYDADADGKATYDPSKVVYKKGDLKLHNGEPYYEFLNGRSGYGKQILSKMNILTKEDSWLNKFDFFDSDDAQKSIAGSIAMNVAKIVPLFIPYVGEAYMYTSLALAGTEALATIGKMFTGSENTVLNETTSFLSSLHTGVSDYGKQHAFSMENVLNMVGDTFQFIYSQRLLAEQAPKWFGAKALSEEQSAAKVKELAETNTIEQMRKLRRPITDAEKAQVAKVYNDLYAVNIDKYRNIVAKEIENYQKLGQTISTNYMAITFGTHTYEAAKAEGVEDVPATLLTLGAIAGQYALLKSHIGQWVFPESNIAAQQRKKALELFPKYFTEDITTAMNDGVSKATNAVQKISWAETLWNKGKDFANKVYSTPIQTTAQAAITGGIASGVEMTAFSVLDDVIGQVYNTAQWISGNPHRMHPWENMFERYATSFLGGSVAGLMSIPKLKEAATRLHEMTPEQAYHWVVQTSAEGKGEELIKEVDKIKWTTSDLSAENYIDTPDGERLYEMGTVSDNQDKFIREGIKNEIRLIGRILEAHNAKIGSDAILNNDVRGPLKIAQVKSSTMIQKYVKDYYDTLVDIVKTSKEIYGLSDPEKRQQRDDIKEAESKYKELEKKYQETKKEEDKKAMEIAKSNLDDLNTLSTNRKKLGELLDRKNKFLNGELEAEYKEKALFEMSEGINKAFLNANVFPYIEKMFGKSFSSLTEAERLQGIKAFKEFKATNASDYVESAFDIFKPLNKIASDYLKDIKINGISKDLDFNDTRLLKFITGDVKSDIFNLIKLKPIDENLQIKGAELFYDRTIEGIVEDLYRPLRGSRSEILDSNFQQVADDVEVVVADLRLKLAKAMMDQQNLQQTQGLPKVLFEDIYSDLKNYKDKVRTAIRTLESMLYSKQAASIILDEVSNMKAMTPILQYKLSGIANELLKYRKLSDIVTVKRKYDSDFKVIDEIQELIPEQYKQSVTALDQALLSQTDPNFKTFSQFEKFEIIKKLRTKLNEVPQLDLIDVLTKYGKTITNGEFDFSKVYKIFSDTFIDNSQDLEQYLIGQADLNDAQIAMHILEAFKSSVVAANDVVREFDNIFGYNTTVNSLHGNNDLTVIPEADTAILLDHVNLLEEQLDFFTRITYAAGASKFRDLIKVDNDIVFNFYTTLSKKFEKIPDNWTGKEELLSDIKNIKNLPDLIKAGSRDLKIEEQNQAYKGLIDFENAVHKFFQKNLDKVQDVDELSKFLDIFDCFTKDAPKVEAIGDKAGFVDDNALLYYVASICSLNPDVFYSNLKQSIVNGKAPTVAQQVAVKMALAFTEDNKIFNSFREAFNKKMDKIQGMKNTIHHSVFDEAFLIEAGPGAGKSSGILPLYTSFLRTLDKQKLKNIWIASTQPKNRRDDQPINQSAITLRDKCNILESESKVFTKQQLMEEICENYNVKITEENTLSLKDSDLHYDKDTEVATYANNKLREDFDTNTLPKVIIIDECSDYSDLDFRLITEFAKKYGAKLILAGDTRQVALRGTYTLPDKSLYKLDLVRTQFARTFLNNTSFRTNNTQQDFNFMVDRTQLLPLKGNENTTLTYRYYVDDSGLYGRYFDTQLGDISDETKANIDLMLRTIKDDETIGFVYDSEDGAIYKYIDSLPNELKSKIEFHKNQPIKGVESRYYIVELDQDLGTVDAFENYKSILYTAFSRAIQGNVVHIPDLGPNIAVRSFKQSSNGLLRDPTEAIASYNAQLGNFLTSIYPEPIKLPKTSGSETSKTESSTTEESKTEESKAPESETKPVVPPTGPAGPPVVNQVENGIGNIFNPIIPAELDKTVDTLNDTSKEIDIHKSSKKTTLYKIGKKEISDVELEEFIWELYTSFNNYTGLIEDPDLGLRESSKSSYRFDNYYGLKRLIELYNGDKDLLIGDKPENKKDNLIKEQIIIDTLQQLRELIWYESDFNTLQSKIEGVLKDKLDLQQDFEDFYIRFMFESSYHRKTDSDGDRTSSHRSKDEKLYGVDGSAKDKDKISAKGLALHIGAKVTDAYGEHDTVLLSVPFSKLPNPFTIMLLLRQKAEKHPEYQWIEQYYTDSYKKLPTPFDRLVSITQDLEKTIIDNNGKVETGQLSLYYLLRTYLYNGDGYTPIVRDKSSELFQTNWTPAQTFKSTSPYIVSSARGVNYEYARPDSFSGVDLKVNDGKVEYIDVTELRKNPTLTVSGIHVVENDVVDSHGSVVIKKGDPFVLVGTKFNESVKFTENTLFEHLNKQLLDDKVDKKVTVEYVRQPRATIEEYLDQLKNLTKGKTPDYFIGNDFTSYRILQLLSIKQEKLEGKSYIEEIYNNSLNKVNIDKYKKVFDEFVQILKEKIGDLSVLDTYEDPEAFKKAATLLREPSGYKVGKKDLHYSQILNNLVRLLLTKEGIFAKVQNEGGVETTLGDRIFRDIKELWKNRYKDDTIPYNINYNTENISHTLGKAGEQTAIYKVIVDSDGKFAGKPYKANIVRTPVLEGNLFPLLASLGFAINGETKLTRIDGRYQLLLGNSGLSRVTGKDAAGKNIWGTVDLLKEGIRMSETLNKKPEGAEAPKRRRVYRRTKKATRDFEVSSDSLKRLGLQEDAQKPDIISAWRQNGLIYIEDEGVTKFLDKEIPGYHNHYIQDYKKLSNNEILITVTEYSDTPTTTEVKLIIDDPKTGKLHIIEENVIKAPEPEPASESIKTPDTPYEQAMLKSIEDSSGMDPRTLISLDFPMSTNDIQELFTPLGVNIKTIRDFIDYRNRKLKELRDEKDKNCNTLPF